MFAKRFDPRMFFSYKMKQRRMAKLYVCNLEVLISRCTNGLSRDNTIIIVPADKGKAVVLLDASDYQHMIDEIFFYGNYLT